MDTKERYMFLHQDDPETSSVQRIIDFMNENNLNRLMLQKGSCVIKNDDSTLIVVPKVEIMEFVDVKTEKLMRIKDGKCEYLEEYKCNYAEDVDTGNQDFIMKAASKYDEFITTNAYLCKVNRGSTNSKTGMTYMGLSVTGKKMWNGFKFTDIETGKKMIVENGKIIELKEEN